MLTHEHSLMLGEVFRIREEIAFEKNKKLEEYRKRAQDEARRSNMSLEEIMKEHCLGHGFSFPPTISNAYRG